MLYFVHYKIARHRYKRLRYVILVLLCFTQISFANNDQASLSVIAKSNWLLNGKASDYLPSSTLKCKRNGDRLFCRTQRRHIRAADGDYHYYYQSELFNFSRSGFFLVQVRKVVLFVLPCDHCDETKLPKQGSRKIVVELNCQLQSSQIHCFDTQQKEFVFTHTQASN